MDYISVPVVPEVLRAKVKVCSDLHRKSRQLEALNAELRNLSGSLIATQDDERRRVARQLHDELGQDLVAAKMMMDSIVRYNSPQAVEQAAVDASKLNRFRDSTGAEPLPTCCILRCSTKSATCGRRFNGYVEGVAKSSGIAISLDIKALDFPRPAPELRTAIFRIIQEALTNVFRHSEARKGLVTVLQKEGQVFISVQDYGKGIGGRLAHPRGIGVGIRGMKQRANELGAESCEISDADPGTLVEVVRLAGLLHHKKPTYLPTAVIVRPRHV